VTVTTLRVAQDGPVDIEHRLSEVLSEFARTLGTAFPIQGILDHLVRRIVDMLPITGAGVTLIVPGATPRYVAASDDAALRYEQLQTELGEGPCLAAYESGDAVAVPDLHHDDRFPTFGPRALEEGLVAVFTFPLRDGDDRLGALDLYRTSPGPLNSDEMAAAQTLADVAAAYLLNAQARDDLQESTERSRRTALHDALTGLPNRLLLVERLEQALARSARTGKVVAILFADLDLFKAVNDTYGHHVGDELLVAVARRLAALLRSGDTLARLAGDEFVILCEDLDTCALVHPVAARIVGAMGQPFALAGDEVHVTASIGIAFASASDADPEEILRDADTAMYQAKRRGGARHGVIDLSEQRVSVERAGLQRDLNRATGADELRLDYQPIVSSADGRVIGSEALLRWDHPVQGVVGPATVVPLAERAGLIGDIGCWVLDRACRDLHRWQHRGPFEVSVNVSAHELMRPGFVATVKAVLADTRTTPAHVTLEITETAFIADADRAALVLEDLKRLGVRLALDDFGTGYSSLSFLKRFPIDLVKIDRQLITDIDRDPDNRVIVSSVIALAHGLRLGVVAEGVETVQQHRELVALGCDAAQGFYFARPRPAADLDEMFAARGPDLMLPLDPPPG